MILLDFEIPIVLAAEAVTWALGAQQALIDSAEGEERQTDGQTLLGDLRRAFSGFSTGVICSSVAVVSLVGDDETSCKVVALFSNISSCGPCTSALVSQQHLSIALIFR